MLSNDLVSFEQLGPDLVIVASLFSGDQFLKERIGTDSFQSRPLFGRVSSLRESNRKSEKLFSGPFLEIAE